MKEILNEILTSRDPRLINCVFYWGIGLIEVTLVGLYVFS